MTTRPDWDAYFINIAKVVASRSTCLRRRYGAVVTRDNVIISTGYNGAPRGMPNCVDVGTCKREELNVPPGERYELCEAVHAEQNALINAPPDRLKDGTIYIASITPGAKCNPCKLCDRMIRNAQIARVVPADTIDGP